MKRPHRRAHLLTWIILGPATALAGVFFWTMRPSEPTTELPASIETLTSGEDAR